SDLVRGVEAGSMVCIGGGGVERWSLERWTGGYVTLCGWPNRIAGRSRMKYSRAGIGIVVAVMVAGWGCAPERVVVAQDVTAEIAADVRASLDVAGEEASALVADFVAGGRSAGVAVSVGYRGEIIWNGGFGFADLEQRVPVSPEDTKFRVGSVAKPMTALAVAQLYEAGVLDIDAPIQEYVPAFPEKRATITTRMVAGHTAGIRHY